MARLSIRFYNREVTKTKVVSYKQKYRFRLSCRDVVSKFIRSLISISKSTKRHKVCRVNTTRHVIPLKTDVKTVNEFELSGGNTT
jgi:hypothetical protein